MAASVAYQSVLRGAYLTALTLFGGMLLGVAAGQFVFDRLPGHDTFNPSSIHVILAATPVILGLLAGSAAWGIAMGSIAQNGSRRRMAAAGILGFVPITILWRLLCLGLEPIAVENFGARVPIHRVFTLFFVPTAFLIAGFSAWVIGLGLHDRRMAWKLGLGVGLTAAAAFLLINLGMEAAGWVVGAPNAAERLTMLTVMFAGDLGAALAGGGLMGWILSQWKLDSMS